MINNDVNMCMRPGIFAATILTRVMGLCFFSYMKYRRGKSCVSNSSYTVGENYFKLSYMINHDVNMCDLMLSVEEMGMGGEGET